MFTKRNSYTFAAYMFVVGLFVYVFGQATYTNVDFIGWAICAISLVGAAIYAHINGDIKEHLYPIYDSCFRRRYKYFGAKGVHERAFTLPELLVVIVIIGIMLALLLPALAGAIRRAKVAQVNSEINVMATALEAFRTEYGEYPPSRLVCCEDGNYAPSRFPPELQVAASRSVYMLRKFFPRMQIGTDGRQTWSILRKPGPNDPKSKWHDFNGNGSPDSGYYVLQGHQCLTLFLGGLPAYTGADTFALVGFSTSPFYPFSPAKDDSATDVTWHMFSSLDQRKKPFYQFDTGRLIKDGQFYGYIDPLGRDDEGAFYVYFSAYGENLYDPDDVNFVEVDYNGNSPLLGAFETRSIMFSSPSPNPYTIGWSLALDDNGSLNTKTSFSCQYHKQRAFQIISAGFDRKYGIGGRYDKNDQQVPLYFPVGANQIVTKQSLDKNIRTLEDDNITNFAINRLN